MPFTHEVRAGYGDTDQGGIVHHSVYLRWLEEARVEFLRAEGVDYKRLERDGRVGLAVARADLRYVLPARFDDLLTVELEVARARGATIVLDYRIRRDDALLLEATLTLACIDLDRMRPIRLPPELLATAE